MILHMSIHLYCLTILTGRQVIGDFKIHISLFVLFYVSFIFYREMIQIQARYKLLTKILISIYLQQKKCQRPVQIILYSNQRQRLSSNKKECCFTSSKVLLIHLDAVKKKGHSFFFNYAVNFDKLYKFFQNIFTKDDTELDFKLFL